MKSKSVYLIGALTLAMSAAGLLVVTLSARASPPTSASPEPDLIASAPSRDVGVATAVALLGSGQLSQRGPWTAARQPSVVLFGNAGRPFPVSGAPVYGSNAANVPASFGQPDLLSAGPLGTLAGEEALLSPPLPGSTDLAICMTTDRVWGIVGAGETVTVTVNGAQMGADEADQIGFFWTTLYDAGGNQAGLTSGNQVRIYHDGVQAASVALRSISGQVNVMNDVVSGTIGGISSPISVTVYVGNSSGEPAMTSYSRTISTDASGNFSADFTGIWGSFYADDSAVVAYVANGVEVHQQVHTTRIAVLPFPFNSVNGWTTPGGVVTTTVYSYTGAIRGLVTDTAETSGRYQISVTILTSDTVVAELADGTVLSRTMDALSVNIDPANDRITGIAASGAKVRGYANDLTPAGWRVVQASATAAASGVYTIGFGGVADIMPGQWAGVHVADGQGDDLALWTPTPSVDVNQTSDEVSGHGVVPFGLGDGWPVTLTLYSAASDTTFVYSKGMEGWYGSYGFNPNDGLPDIAPGDVVTVESEGYPWQGVVQVMTMSVQADLVNDRFTGTVVAPTDRVELGGYYDSSQLYPIGGSFDMLVTATSPFTGTPSGFDVDNYLFYGVAHRTANDYIERIDRVTDGFGMWLPGNGMWGWVNPPGTPYTITLSNNSGDFKARLTGTSLEPSSEMGWHDFWNTGEQMQAGDRLQVQSAAGFSETVIIPDIVISPDIDNDIVTGSAPANTLLHVSVDGQGEGFVPTDSSGHYAFKVSQLQSLSGDGDFEWGEQVSIGYIGPKRTWVFDGFQWPQITVRTNMDGVGDVIGGNAFPDNTITITVTHPISGVVATGTTEAGACEWAGPTDFCLEFPSGTLIPGNTVTVDFGEHEGSVYVDSVEVVTLTGQADVSSDIVTGIAPAEGQVSGWVEDAHGNRGPDIGVQVDASGVYTLDFGGQGWDVQYGDSCHVYYAAPHGHSVEYWFWLPAPEVGVQKNTVGGLARPGGKYVYSIAYWNDGNGVATDTLIVDTLPVSTTYAGDTSGLPHIEANGVITWDLGNLPARGNNDNWGVFAVTLDVSASVTTGTGSLTQNCVVISTSAPGDYNPGNESSCAGPVDVWEDDVNISVNKWPNLSDPTPGQEFDYTIQWCGTSGANFGPVWLTDTLPVSSTIVGWSTDWPWNMWTEVITTGGQLALYAPGLPGGYCQNIYLRLLLDPDVPLDTVLGNTVVVTTPYDRDLDDNIHTNTDARVGPPRYDMWADKWFGGGVLISGGWIGYGAGAWNRGNSAVHVWLTDTLPSGTSYRPGSARESDGGPAFPPAIVTDDYVVWDLGVLGVNEDFRFDFTVDVSDTVSLGVITNCASAGIAAAEDTPWDNTDCVTETINASGPNLRVRKDRGWNGDNQLDYTIQFYNVGNQTINDVWITDTLPAATTWDGWWNLQFDGSRLISQSLGSNLLTWEFSSLYPGDSGGIEFHANLDDPNARPRWYTNTVEIDVPAGDTVPGDNAYTLVDVKGEVERAEMWIANAGANMWGRAQPDAPITITTALNQYTDMVSGGGDWNINNIEALEPGDHLTVTAGAGLAPVVITIPDPFSAAASSITDTVWGRIDALDHAPISVDLYNYGSKNAQTDGSGAYSVAWSDVPRGGQGHVRYETTMDYAQVVMHRRYQTPDLALRVNYGHDWVEGNYEAGHTVVLTVTASDGVTVKGSAVLTTGAVPFWGGQTGFSTNWQGWTGQPDIVAGDWVYGVLDNRYTSTVRVGTITGNVNDASDIISGTITAAWFTEVLQARCEVWVQDGPPSINISVNPNGGSYECDFSTVGWDILPGQDVAVTYSGPDANDVINVFYAPAPDMNVQKRVEGNEAAPGGPIVFTIQYVNQGNAAGHAILTDTLPVSTTYVSDSSGFPADVSGGVVTWDLGTVEPFVAPGSFQLVLTNTANPGDTLRNTVDIATDYDRNTGNNHAEAEVHINDTGARPDLNVGKNPQPGDPAPGQLMRYNIDYGNNGSVASGPVWLTDTLPLSTTFVSWESRNGYTLWSEVITTGGQFVLTAPSIPGNWGDTIYLTLRVSGAMTYGEQLLNTVEIATADDSDPGNNGPSVNGDAWVSPPRYNLSLDKSWGHGSPVPGGTINYWINYNNNGNSPAHNVLLTDTLPAGTTFITSVLDLGWGVEVPFPPTQIVGNRLAWNVGTLEVNAGQSFMVRLLVNTTTAVGTVFTNCATIAMSDFEDSPYDNAMCVAETVRSSTGPDLSVTKYAYWQWWDRIQYQVRIRNVGTSPAYNVTVTETYPLSMAMNWWNVNCLGRSCSNSPQGSNPFTVTFEVLNPGDTTWLNMELQVPAVPNGTLFTNTVRIDTSPGDTTPADNSDQVVVGTGPDLRIEKRLTGGSATPNPGDLLTFTLHFQNVAQGWGTSGNVLITDTLPAGLVFISSQQRLCGGSYFCQRDPNVRDGTMVAWTDYGQLSSGGWNDFVITVLVTNTAKVGDVLTNTAEIATDDPANDVEPFTDDNTSTAAVIVSNPVFQVGKVYAGNRVAGTVVTYTLTVTNSGNEAGSNVRLIDSIPSWVTYGGGGSYSAGLITWTIPSIAPYGGTATRWFSGTLACYASTVINNTYYQVASSDQGITSTYGAPVAFTTIAPTLNPTFTQSAASAKLNTTVRFTSTSTTNGSAVVTQTWSFGDGVTANGLSVSHAYTRAGSFTVTLAISDTCGFHASAVVPNAIVASEYKIYLPLALRRYP